MGEHRLSPAVRGHERARGDDRQQPDESQALSARRGPMVIIAASGMATGGRVVHHIKAFAPDRATRSCFAGYQAGGTRGASITGGARAACASTPGASRGCGP
jgi:metallo-beta-lactamase family protein